MSLLIVAALGSCNSDDNPVKTPTAGVTNPENNVSSVPRNQAIEITFSEQMDPATINSSTFILMQGTTAVPGVVSYSGNTAIFTPAASLSAGVQYTATVSTGAKNMAGVPLAASKVWNFTTGGATANSPLAIVTLGAAGNYVILAKTAINNSPTSAVTGDMGLSPAATTYITEFSLTDATGYATSSQVTGKVYAANMADPTPINLTTAVNNMITAYNDAAGRPSPDFSELATGNIGGKTLGAGLYKWTTTVTVPGDVTLSGGLNDVWIFQIAGDFVMSGSTKIILSGEAQAKNVFWQVAGQSTIGTSAHVEGNIISKTGITFQTNASMNGRALAQTAVILDKNVIVKP